jgi:hypothetical protein
MNFYQLFEQRERCKMKDASPFFFSKEVRI